MKLIGRLYTPRPPASATKSWKTPKWPKNDQFRQFSFLIKRFFGSSYISFEAESKIKFFEINYRFVRRSIIELLMKNMPKNRSTKFPYTRWPWIPKSPFSMTNQNSINFGGDVIGTKLSVLAQFHLHYRVLCILVWLWLDCVNYFKVYLCMDSNDMLLLI